MTVAIGFLIFANILRSFLSFSSSNMYIFIYIYISFLFSRRRSPLKPRGDQSITRSFEPSSRNGIIVLSSVLTPSFLPSSCLPPRLFILNRFYTHSWDIYYIIFPRLSSLLGWVRKSEGSPFSFFFFFSGEDARVLDRGSGRIRKNRLIHYHCNDGLTGGGEGRKKREEKTAMDGRIVWRRGREKRRFFFWWNLATTIPPPSFVHEVRGPWPISFVSVMILYLLFFQPVKRHWWW